MYVVYARAIGRDEQLALELLDEGRRNLLVVRDDEKDPVDYLLERTVPVGRLERSPLGTSAAEELRVLLLPPGVCLIAQAIVEPEKLHCEVGKPTLTSREGYSNILGLLRLTRGGGRLTTLSAVVIFARINYLKTLRK